jgi:hypothetical protein
LKTEKEAAMTQEQLEVRKERAEQEVFVITAAEEGWRVRSARNPSRFYLVSGDGAGFRCTCPDFQSHAPQDPAWRCKHVLAVQDHQAKTGAADSETERELAEERAAVQAEGSGQAQPVDGEPTAAQMLIKRSISPDGRIDSISSEFAFPLAEATVNRIKDRALKTLKLQTEIVKGFLNGAGAERSSGKRRQSQTQKGNGAVFARLLDVGVTNGQYGERFYLNVEVNGRRARMFGTAAQIARAISTAGERLFAQDIEPGLRVDLPCRVFTEESRDGRYLNVTRVLPLPRQGNQGARQ